MRVGIPVSMHLEEVELRSFQHGIQLHGHWKSDTVWRYLYTNEKTSEAVASTFKHFYNIISTTLTLLGWAILLFSFLTSFGVRTNIFYADITIYPINGIVHKTPEQP